ncbi:MAG: PHP domain-containing protein, partial [Thermogutta sp.]|nr:PHP domain-containing protein [Thermogutta sp.]
MTNAEIAAVFDQVADLLEFQGANPFRIRAYRAAARTIGELVEPLSQWVESGRDLRELPGIGDDLSQKIATLLSTGTLPLLEELKAEFPESVLSLLRVQGLGPKRAAVLYRELNIRSLEDLLAACEAHRVRELKGFGAKTEENILKGLRAAMEESQRILWYQADQLVRDLTAYLASVPGLRRCEPAGSYRRGKETVGDLDILAAAEDPEAVMRHFERFPGVRRVLAGGTTKAAVELNAGLNADLRVVPEESFGAALQYFTGSKEHNVVLRGMAKERGLKINEYGVFRGEDRIAGEDEEGVYAALGLPWIPPELREGRWEFDWALGEGLPELITLDDIRGDLHMHTTWTDGMATVEEMARAAKERGYAYIAITDHSQRVTVAGGLTPEKVLRQWEAIDRIAAEIKG